MPERPRRRVVGAARSFGGGAGSAALVLEVLVGRHGTVQRVGDPVLGLAIGCPVALCHSCVGILDGLVHVGQGLIQPLLGSAVLGRRSEEHTSELQSRGHLVCRLLLEKKTTNTIHTDFYSCL